MHLRLEVKNMTARPTGVFIDLTRDSYKLVRLYCIEEEVLVKEFVLECLREGMKNDKIVKKIRERIK